LISRNPFLYVKTLEANIDQTLTASIAKPVQRWPAASAAWIQARKTGFLFSVAFERERERREEKVEGGAMRDTTMLEKEGNRNRVWQFEGSQAVPASPSGRDEACIRDLFNFYFLKMLEWL
jgi:hypothetical protein